MRCARGLGGAREGQEVCGDGIAMGADGLSFAVPAGSVGYLSSALRG